MLLILLVGSWEVRIFLNLQGGQLAAVDERRYFRSFDLIRNLRQMNLRGRSDPRFIRVTIAAPGESCVTDTLSVIQSKTDKEAQPELANPMCKFFL